MPTENRPSAKTKHTLFLRCTDDKYQIENYLGNIISDIRYFYSEEEAVDWAKKWLTSFLDRIELIIIRE